MQNSSNFSEEQYEQVDLSISEHMAEALELFGSKNRQYGNAIDETGLLGATVELVGITARLKQLVIRDSLHGRQESDKIRPVLLDAINYAAIAIYQLDRHNWEGR